MRLLILALQYKPKKSKDDFNYSYLPETIWLYYFDSESHERVVALGIIRSKYCLENIFTPLCAFLVVAVQWGAFNNYMDKKRGVGGQ